MCSVISAVRPFTGLIYQYTVIVWTYLLRHSFIKIKKIEHRMKANLYLGSRAIQFINLKTLVLNLAST